ncbi:MAG: hypothetical protein FWJ70_06225 [Micromonosporaceae bacterium]|jgi:hypothetical protein
MTRPAAAVLALALVTAGAACGGPTGTEQPVQDGSGTQAEGTVRTASRDEAAVLVHERAAAVVGFLDAPVENPTIGPAPCEDPAGGLSKDGVYFMSAKQQVVVGEGRLAEALRRLHGYFSEQGFDTEEIRWLENGTGTLRATDPDGFRYSLLPTDPPVAFALFVDSPCYRAPEGEDPMDGRWRPPPEVGWSTGPG